MHGFIATVKMSGSLSIMKQLQGEFLLNLLKIGDISHPFRDFQSCKHTSEFNILYQLGTDPSELCKT